MRHQSDPSAQLRSIASLKPGEQAKVQSIAGGRGLAQRMYMIGIRPGVDLRLVHGPGQRGAVVMVGGARIALGRGVIERIHVASITVDSAAREAVAS